MKIFNLIRTIMVVMALLTSQVSVFADDVVHVNQDASASNPLICTTNPDYTIRWIANEVEQKQFENYDLIDTAYLHKGDTWVCEALELEYNPYTYELETEFKGSESTVIKNSAPVIISTPVTTGTVGLNYSYDVNAVDADSDVLTYSLVSAPAGVYINSATGMITWMPAAGTHNIVVSVTDGEATATQSFTLTVGSTAVILSVTISAAPASGNAPLNVVFTPVVYNASGTATYAWDFDGDSVVESTNAGISQFTYTSAGTYTARLTVTDSVATATGTVIISVGGTTDDDDDDDDDKYDEDDIFIDAITFKNNDFYPGDLITALVTLENEADYDFDDLELSMSISELDIKEAVEFDLNDGKKKTIELSIELPDKMSSGDYLVKFKLENDDVSIVEYREIYVNGNYRTVVGNKIVPKDDVSVVSQVSLSSYQPTEQKSRINWLGVWFMILIILLLIGIAAYLVRMLAEESQQKEPDYTELDRGF